MKLNRLAGAAVAMLVTGAWFTAVGEEGKAENWPRWRGPRDNGSTEAGRYPVKWSGQLPRSGASYYSSPAIADGKVYAAREDGVVFVARVEGQFELLSENNMGERIIAAPVPVGNRLLLRGEKTLFCIASQ